MKISGRYDNVFFLYNYCSTSIFFLSFPMYSLFSLTMKPFQMLSVVSIICSYLISRVLLMGKKASTKVSFVVFQVL